MSATRFELATNWRLRAPVSAIWHELTHPEEWPQWWRGVVAVHTLDPGDERGLGARHRMTWRSALPYHLTFEMRTVRIERPTLIEGIARGELAGVGRWTLEPDGTHTRVRYDWHVEATRPWMRAFAPVLRRAFAWNHDVVMEWGRRGLLRRLGISELFAQTRA
jgi:hypothetical protein